MQRWWSGFKLAVSRVLRRPLVGRIARVVLRGSIPNRGIRIDARDPYLDDATVAALVSQTYESPEIRFIRAHLQGAEQVVELGGSLGITGAHLLDVMSPVGRLVSVEADPALVEPLRRRLDRHRGVGQRVDVVAAAVAGRDGDVGFRTGTSLVGAVDPTSELRIEGTTLRSLLGAHGVVGPYGLVCDVEGAEHDLVADDPDAFGACHTMVIELHGDHDRIEALITRIEHLGFEVAARHGRVLALHRPPVTTVQNRPSGASGGTV